MCLCLTIRLLLLVTWAERTYIMLNIMLIQMLKQMFLNYILFLLHSFFYKHMNFWSLGYMCLIQVLNSWTHLGSVPYMCLIFLKNTVPYRCLNQDQFFSFTCDNFPWKKTNFHKNYTFLHKIFSISSKFRGWCWRKSSKN